MKTLLKILLACLGLFLVLVVGAYFLLTNSGFQKRMIEKRLPAGSSVESVKITLNSAAMEGLVLALPDGTRMKMADFRTEFSPLAAAFDRTIETGVIRVDGLLVDLPTRLIAEETPPPQAATTAEAPPTAPADGKPAPSEPTARENPLQGLYQIAQIDWIFDIEGVDLDGRVRDAAGNQFGFEMSSGPIRPGRESTINLSLSLVSGESLQAGLKNFSASSALTLGQQDGGGFDFIGLESELKGSDAQGAQLVAASQSLELRIEGFEETADLNFSLQADVPRPELLAPELSSLGAVLVGAEMDARAEGRVLRLETADLFLSSGERRVIDVDLKQSLVLGSGQEVTGDLLELRLSEMPVAWVNPALGDGLNLRGAPLSLTLNLAGEAGGALHLSTPRPITLGPLTLSRDGQPLLSETSFLLEPDLRIGADQSLRYELRSLEVSDRYGAFIEASGQGSWRELPRGPENLFAGIQSDTRLRVDLPALFRQPLIPQDYAMLGGVLSANVKVSEEAEYPLQVRGALRNVRTPDSPAGRDYRFALQTRQKGAESWQLGANLEAGPESLASTSLQIAGELAPGSEPLVFSLALTGPRLSQTDITLLSDAFAAADKSGPAAPVDEPPAPGVPGRPAPAPAPSDETVPPPWAGLDGTATIDIEEIVLASGKKINGLKASARASESLLALADLAARFDGGRLAGGGEVSYAPRESEAYAVRADFDFENFDPSMFVGPGDKVPVRGTFDGGFQAKGSGASLEAALDAANGEATLSGTNGVVTAFELDGRSQLGLVGVGLLGQQLNRPGVAALAQTVPYFKDIRFDEFTLKLSRGDDRRVMIPRLRIAGQNLLIDASGFIAATSWADIMEQPLDLNLGLGAKGRLVEYLESLNLLQPETTEDGYRRWSKDVAIGGTLGNPNTDAIMDLLNRAARSALKRPAPAPAAPDSESAETETEEAASEAEASAEAEEPRKKSKEERVIEDVATGLELLNRALGN